MTHFPIKPSCTNQTKELPQVRHIGFIASIGERLQKSPKLTTGLQCFVFALYVIALIVGMTTKDEVVSNWVKLFFWGLGWPLILLSTLFIGRFWCGILCPDGALTEWISHHGLKRTIPKWMRYRWWPYLLFMIIVVYGQFAVQQKSALSGCLLLVACTVLALVCGVIYGNGRRIWCMYLCPIKGLLEIFATQSCLYFKVNPKKWADYDGPKQSINCAPLINIKKMTSASECHACGRCSHYRDAVYLSAREPFAELHPKNEHVQQRLFLIWCVAGVASVLLAWSESRIFIYLRESLPFIETANFVAIALIGFLLSVVLTILLKMTQSFAQLEVLPSRCLYVIASWGIFIGWLRRGAVMWQNVGFEWHAFVWIERCLLVGAAIASLIVVIRTCFIKASFRHMLSCICAGMAVMLLVAVWLR